MAQQLTVNDLLWGYHNGWFPMAESDGEIYWFNPPKRGVIELDKLKISRSLQQTVKKNIFDIRINTAFKKVMQSCAARAETWISDEIIRAYYELHAFGYAHSVESWRDKELVGGLYGVAIGGAFFGESMFSAMTDASKVALVALVERMKARKFVLLDTQFITPHLQRLGAIEIPGEEYLRRLYAALKLERSFA
jgi:leucyl/phenylalanyl-tRNA--protein transferase